MGARDRLMGLAGRALLRATESKDAVTRRATGGSNYVFGGNPYTSTWDVDKAVRDGFEKVIWVFKAIEANAEQAASWPVRAMQGSEPDWRMVDDPILPLFRSSRINPVDGSAHAFLTGYAMQFQLSKAGVFIEVIPSKSGGVAALYLLPPGHTRPIPDADTFVSGFEVTHPSGEISRLKAYDPKTRSGVLWVKKRHPTNPYSSTTVLEAAGISIDLDFYARLYNRNFLLNDGRAGQLVAVKGGLSQEDAQELKARFSPGMGGVGRTTVIEAEAITVQDTAVSPRDAQYAELRAITKEDLLIALGTPESVLGNASGRTFDNADAEKEGWLDTTVKNLTKWMAAGMDGLTAGGWDDDVHLWFDYSGEPVLQRAQRNREKDAAEKVAAGLITVDEYRDIANLTPMNRPGSKVLWIPGGKAAVGEEEDETAAGELKPIGGGAPAPAAPGMDPAEMAATARGGAIAGAAQAQEARDSEELGESQAQVGRDGAFADEKALHADEGKGFNPKQPRYPRGHPKGGQWLSDVDIDLWKQGKPLTGGWDSSKVKDPETGKVGKPETGPNAAGADNSKGPAPKDAKPGEAPAAAAASKDPAHWTNVLTFGPDYPYPKLAGGIPAKKLAAPKDYKASVVRKGDVVEVDGKEYVVASALSKNGTVKLQDVDGGTKTLDGLDKDSPLKVVARTAHPKVAADAKKAKAADEASGAVSPVEATDKPLGADTPSTPDGGAESALQADPDPMAAALDEFEANPPVPVVLDEVGPDPLSSGADAPAVEEYLSEADQEAALDAELDALEAAEDAAAAATPDPKAVVDSVGVGGGDSIDVHADGSGVMNWAAGDSTPLTADEVTEMIGMYGPKDAASPADIAAAEPENIDLDELDDLFDASQGDAVPDNVMPAGTYTTPTNGEMVVNADGSGTFTAASGQTIDYTATDVWEMQSSLLPKDAAEGGTAPNGLTIGQEYALKNSAWTAKVNKDGSVTVDEGDGGDPTTYPAEVADQIVGGPKWDKVGTPAGTPATAGAAKAPNGLPIGEVYANENTGWTATVQPDGGVIVDYQDGSTGTLGAAGAAVNLASPGWAPLPEHEKPKPAAALPAGKYKGTGNAVLTVHEDGTGTMTYDNGTTQGWTASEVAEVADMVNPVVEEPAAPKAPDMSGLFGLLTGLKNKTVPAYDPDGPGAVIDYPPDYPYPVVDDAPAANTLATPKPIKGSALRKGDVILVSGQEVTVAKTKKAGDATEVFVITETGGKLKSVGYIGSAQTVPVVARTPHPKVTADAKKAKQEAGLAPTPILPGAVKEPAAAPAPTATSPASTPAPIGATSNLPDPPAPAAPATGGVSMLDMEVSEKQLLGAKTKPASSGLLKKGATVLLPNGGAAQLTSGMVAEPGNPPYSVIYGYPTSKAPAGVLGQTPNEDGAVPIWSNDPGHPAHPIYGQGGFSTDLGYLSKALAGKGQVTGKSAHTSTTAQPVAVLTPKDGGVTTVDTAGFKQVGAQGGSNLGGLFEAPDGTRYYVKAPNTATHAQNEVLANRLYQSAGASVSEVSYVPELSTGVLAAGKPGIASKIVDGKKDLSSKFTDPAYKAKLQEDFAVHAWLGNWDAAGAAKDNIITGADGNPVMIDGGGSLLYRAMGTPKGDAFGSEVTELKSMLDPGTNPQTAQVFGGLTTDGSDANYVAGVKKVLAVSPQQIDKMVDETMTSMSAADRDALKTKLKARREFLAKSAGLELPETQTFNESLVAVNGGTVKPFDPDGVNSKVDTVFVGGEKKFFHTQEVGAKSLKEGDVISYKGDPDSPYVVTKVGPGANGKDKVFGKKNGTGPEKELFQAESSSTGERKVQVQTEPAPGWAPPPPPPPPTPGAKLVPPPVKKTSAKSSVGAVKSMEQINETKSSNQHLKSAWERATPEQKAHLAAAGLDDPQAFASHIGSLGSSWNGSSNDSKADLLAFHRATAQEFDLDHATGWNKETGSLKTNVDDHYAKYGEAYKVAARLTYDQTQQELKDAGVEYITLYRGISYQDPSSNMGYGVAAPPWAWQSGTTDDVQLRPLSSFTWNNSSKFGGTVVSATVPREMIFSTNGAGGFGTDYEHEAVVLGAKVTWDVSNPVKPSKPGYGVEQYNQQYGISESGAAFKADGDRVYNPFAYPNDFSEDWLKTAWPFVDADGDAVTSLAEMDDLYPNMDPVELLTLPVGAHMPPVLKAELLAALADEDDDAYTRPAPDRGREAKTLTHDDDDSDWVGLGG